MACGSLEAAASVGSSRFCLGGILLPSAGAADEGQRRSPGWAWLAHALMISSSHHRRSCGSALGSAADPLPIGGCVCIILLSPGRRRISAIGSIGDRGSPLGAELPEYLPGQNAIEMAVMAPSIASPG